VNEPTTAYALYKRLLRLYPREFRERLEESMQQTFNDLYNEQKQQPGHSFFLLAIFAETGMGIAREYLLILMQRDLMKNILASPNSAAITSFILALPIGLLRLLLGSDVEALIAPVESVLTVDGFRPNTLGYTIICGGLLLLPVAFVLNLSPILKRAAPDGQRRRYTLNIIVGIILSILILFTWGGLLLEEIYCLQGIRCD
jgi:hypothetical protein